MMKHDLLDPYFKAARKADLRFPAALSDRILSDATSCLAQNARVARSGRRWAFPKLRLPVLLPSPLVATLASLAVAALLVPGDVPDDITPSASEIASLTAPETVSTDDDAMMLNAWLHGWTEPAEEDISEDRLVAAYISAQ